MYNVSDKAGTILKGLLCGTAATALCSVSTAQELDYSADANFGSFALEAGFLPDPLEVEIVSGGYVDLTTALPDTGCTGFATEAPDMKLEWTQSEPGFLRVWVESEGDTTLAINDAEGNWLCDDDSYGDMNPLIELDAAVSGRYDIWVGSYSAEDNFTSVLKVSEIAESDESAHELDYSADANYGSLELETGFLPDPWEVEMMSGGDVDLALAIDEAECAGYATANPDLKLQWTQAETGLLRLWVESEGDTTLVINDSNGVWHCDDDSAGGINPLVELNAAESGQFDIWVGSYSREETLPARLMISELGGE